MNVPWWLAVLMLEFPVLLALLDCYNREPHEFAKGAEDRKAWLGWLAVATVAIFAFLAGYGIVLGYYYVVVRRNAPSR